MNLIQIIPTLLTIQTQPLTSSVEEQDVNSSPVIQQSLEQIAVLETQLKSRTEELENANVEVCFPSCISLVWYWFFYFGDILCPQFFLHIYVYLWFRLVISL